MRLISASPNHYQEITDIYNWAIENTTATFDTEVKSLENFTEFLNSIKKQHLIVIEDEGQVIGWGCLKPFSDRSAYNNTVELSLYIAPENHAQGLGTLLMKKLVLIAIDSDVKSIISKITEESTPSIRLHEKFSFDTVGTMKEVGHKFDRWINVVIMQKTLF